MAVYEFRGLNAAGKTITGLKEADSPKTLRGLLKKEGVFLTDVMGQTEGKSNRAPVRGAAARGPSRPARPSTRTSICGASRAAESAPTTSRS